MPDETDRGTARDPHEVIHPNHDLSAVRVPDTDDLAGVGPLGVTVVVHTDEDEDEDFQPPKGRLRATVSLGVSQSIDNTEGGVSRTFFPQITAAFGVGDSALGLLNAIGFFARMLFGPVWAIAADRFGRKRILLLVTGAWGLWTVATGFAQSWTMLLILYTIALIGTVASEPILNGLLGSLYHSSERGKAFGTVRGVSSAIGIVLTPTLGQFGGNPDGWRYAMFVMGGLSIFSGLLILLFVHEPKRVLHEDAEELKSEAGMFRLSDAAKLFKIPTLALMAPMLLFVTSLILFGFVGTYWARDLGYGVTNASYLYTVMTIGMTISAFLGGFLGDLFAHRFGDKGRIMLFQLYALLVAASTFVMVRLAPVFDPDVAPGTGNAVTNTPSVAYYVMVFITGLIFSWGFSGCVLPMVSRVCPKQLSATSFAVLFSLVQGLITAIYSLSAGAVSQSIGNLQLTLVLFVSIPYVLNAIYWTLFYRFYPRDADLQAERSRLIEQGRF
jgi:MFS family permease